MSTRIARTLASRSADRHASRASLPPADRRPDYYYPPDELDDHCPGCVPELDGGRWVHDRACAFAGRR